MRSKVEMKEEILLRLVSNREVMKTVIDNQGINYPINIGNELDKLAESIAQSYIHNSGNWK